MLGIHICPQEIAQFLSTLPILSWMWVCCKDCVSGCAHKKPSKVDPRMRDWPEANNPLCTGTGDLAVFSHYCESCLGIFYGYKRRAGCRLCVAKNHN